MKTKIETFAQESVDCSCTVLVVLSHGKKDCVYDYEGEPLDIWQDLVYPFNRDNAPHLVGKPKLFIIQACRGGNAKQVSLFPLSAETCVTFVNIQHYNSFEHLSPRIY